MKVGIVTPYYFPHTGGVPSHVSALARKLKNRRIKVKIICPKFGKVKDEEDVIRIGRPIPLLFNGSFTFLSFSAGAKEVVEEEKFDLLHIHEPYNPYSFAFLKTSPRKVATFHFFREDIEDIFKLISKPIVKLLNSSLDVAIAVSSSALKGMREIGINVKTYLVPNGVEVEKFENAQPFPEFLDGKFNIVFVGRLEPRKGVKHLIRAFRTVKKVIPNSRLIIGGGGLLSYYKTFVTDEIKGSVVFTGKLSDSDVSRLLATADICVFPSTRGESFGIVLIEAMASGKPVIAGINSGYLEVTENGKWALLVNPQDEDELARKIIHLYFDRQLRFELSKLGKMRARQFDWNNIVERIIDIYNEVLSLPKTQKEEGAFQQV